MAAARTRRIRCRGVGSIEIDGFEVVLACYGLSKVVDVGVDSVEVVVRRDGSLPSR